MSIRDDFFAAKAKGSLWDVAVSIKRGNPLPLDADSIFESYEALEAYAADVLAYPGQVVAVVNEDSTGIYYLDQNLAIKPVGIIPQGDGKSINVTAEGVISLAGIDSADSLTLPRMKADKSGIEWVPVSAVVEGDGNDNTTYEFTALEDKVGFSVVTKFNGEQVGEAVDFAFDVYTKSEADEKFLAKTDYVPYDDSTLSGKIEVLEGVVGDEKSGLVKDLADEVARATEAERLLGERIDAIDFVDPDELNDVLQAYTTQTYVDGEFDKLEEAISNLNHFKAEVVERISDVTEVGVLYLIKDEEALGNDKYNEYIVVDGEPVLIGDTTTDLSNYYDKTAIDNKVLDINGAIAGEAAARELLEVRVEGLEAIEYVTPDDFNAYKDDVAEAIGDAKDEVLGKVADDYATKTELETLAGDVERDYAKKATTLAGYGIADAYTAAQTDAAILAKIGEMTGGESAADVLALLNAYKASNDREVWGDDFVNNATVDGKYTPDYAGNSRIDDLKAKLDEVESNAEVNVIEVVKVNGVALTPDSNRAVDVEVPTSITGMDGYSALDERVTAAKAQADKGVSDASAAAAQADLNAEEIAKHANRLGILETAKGDHEERIAVLEGKETSHVAEYNALKGRVDGHDTAIAEKASQSALNEVSAKAVANETAISTLNDVTIPGINAEIEKKANANAVYTKSEVEGLIKDSEYDDTGIKGLISGEESRAKSEEARIEGLVTAEESRAKGEEARIEGLVTAEVARAKAAEEKNAEDIVAINALLNTVNNEDSITSLKELAIWVEDHGKDAAKMAEGINNNTTAIKSIYDVVDGKASGTLVDEIARVEKKADDNAAAILAINHATDGVLAQAKAYANEKFNAVPVADGDSIIVNEKKLSVGKVSTDLLAQGDLELVLCGGSANQ